MTRYYIYVCPSCKRPSAEMMPTETTIELTDAQRWEYRNLGPIAHEILQCPCGKVLAWFEMEMVEVTPLRVLQGV